jgi:hypothetical protein
MTTLHMTQQVEDQSADATIQATINSIIDELVASLPDPKQLSSEQRRGIIARYSSVLEGNFVYWMTAAVIAVKSEGAREELLENLHEEVRDAHPAMLRRFAIAAHAFPTDVDALAVNDELTKVRLFLGRLSAVQSLVTMAFFEGFIQRFMAYLAELAADQGSTEMEYTDVHGVCDIEHTQGLFRALAGESTINPLGQGMDLCEGVYLLRSLIDKIVFNKEQAQAA